MLGCVKVQDIVSNLFNLSLDLLVILLSLLFESSRFDQAFVLVHRTPDIVRLLHQLLFLLGDLKAEGAHWAGLLCLDFILIVNVSLGK